MRSTWVFVFSTFLALLSPTQSALIHLQLRPQQQFFTTARQPKPTDAPILTTKEFVPNPWNFSFGWLWYRYIDSMENAVAKGQPGKTIEDFLKDFDFDLKKDQDQPTIIRLF